MNLNFLPPCFWARARGWGVSKLEFDTVPMDTMPQRNGCGEWSKALHETSDTYAGELSRNAELQLSIHEQTTFVNEMV